MDQNQKKNNSSAPPNDQAEDKKKAPPTTVPIHSIQNIQVKNPEVLEMYLTGKDTTDQLEDQPEPEPLFRWGVIFQGEMINLALHIQDHADPVSAQFRELLVMGRGKPARDKRAMGLDLTSYDAHTRGVSRRHAAILKDGDTLKVMDLKSTNGTYLNGSRLVPNQTRILRDGDELMLGKLVITVRFT